MKAPHFATVPLAEIEEKALTAHDDAPAPYVLVVDDDPSVADTLALILRGAGYAAATAYDAGTALRLAELAPPHILVSDVCMPGMDGIELAVRLCASVPDCAVLLISATDQTERLTEARTSGHNFRFLLKPFHPERLLHELSAGRTTAQDSLPDRTDRKGIHLAL